MKYSIGDRVICYLSDRKFIEYEQKSRFIGRVVRLMGFGLIKVELEGTGSQDTEGHDCIGTVHEKACRRIKK